MATPSSQNDELRRMIMTFRVTELQMLLAYTGRARTGRKPELLERAFGLLNNPSFSIAQKIRELHKKKTRSVNGPAISGRDSDTSLSSLRDFEPFSCHYIKPEMPASPFTSEITLISLPFYDKISDILYPTILQQTCFSGRYQETSASFTLTPEQLREICLNRTTSSNGVLSSDVQVQLRFCPMEPDKSELEDYYPPCLGLRLNLKPIQLPNPIPTNKPNADPKRPPRPLDLTWNCKMTQPNVVNTLLIQWALPLESEATKSYCFAISLVRKRSSEYLAQKVMERKARPKRQTESLIRAKLLDDGDDIATTSLKVSLLCPLGKMRMTMPCIPTTCDHIQCFDAQLYLMMNEKKPTWTCPVCDKTARFQDLLIDELFSEICRTAGDYDEILFNPDGSWVPLGVLGKDTVPINGLKNLVTNGAHLSPVKPKEELKPSDAVDVIVLSDSSDEDEGSVWPVNNNTRRPISTISSSDSSTWSSAIPSVSPAHTSNGPPTAISQPTLGQQWHSSAHGLFNPPPTSLHHLPRSLMGLMDPTSSSAFPWNQNSTSAYNGVHYPLFMPTSEWSIHAQPGQGEESNDPDLQVILLPSGMDFANTYRHHFPVSDAPQNLSVKVTNVQGSAPSAVDYVQRFNDDYNLLDDSDIIPLD